MMKTRNSNIKRSRPGEALLLLFGLLPAGAAWGTNSNPVAKVEATQVPQPPTPQTQCPPLDRAKLISMVEAAPEKELQLVFFSGWCSDCRVHLKQLNHPNAVLVGIFDKQARIEKVVSKMKLSNTCFTDAGIGRILDVKTVPTERRVTLEALKKQQ